MNQTTGASRQPPQALLSAMERMRMNDNLGALDLAEAGLTVAQDRAPFLALASVAALRIGAPDRAIPHLRALLAIRPDDRASQFNLANALLETGNFDEALTLARAGSGAQFARLEGFVHQQRDEPDAAIDAYRRAVAADPADFISWNNMANVLAEAGSLNEAISAYERAASLSPRDVGVHLNLADVLRRADRGRARLRVMRRAQQIEPDNRQILTELAMAQAHVEDLEGAVITLEDVVARYQDFGESHIELGRLYEALNRLDDLAALVDRTDLANAPPEAAFLTAWQAQRENRFDDAAVLAESIPETVHPMRRYHLIGQIADRRGDAEAAFAAFGRMNDAALADAPPFVGPTFREKITADIARWTPEWASGWKGIAVDDGQRDPVFLVGFPRSGTTLLDTMLMGQPELSVLEERPMIAEALHDVGEEDLAYMDLDRVTELRGRYFDSARANGWDDERWLVDKHPLNMVRVPLILRMFPKARFILAERHPYDVVLSAFMANFQLNSAMRSFTSLQEAALTYDAVFSAWEQSRAILPVAAHTIRYERLVEDTQAELAPLLQWLGLTWDDRLLAHEETAKTRGRVRTASYSQIGEQLYTRALYRWRRYAPQLAPVRPILAPWAERLGYEVE